MNAFFQTTAFADALRQALDDAALLGGGQHIAECLETAGAVRDGDRESWHAAWIGLAGRVRGAAVADLGAGRRGSARDALLRAACAYRAADAFLEAGDPRSQTTGTAASACFATAARLGSPPALPVPLGGARAPTALLYRIGDADRPCRTLIAVGGSGGGERADDLELYLSCVLPALRARWGCLAASGGTDPASLAALLGTAAALAPVDPGCLAVVTLRAKPGGGRAAVPWATGSAAEVAAILRSAATPEEPALCAGTLGRFHEQLFRWLDR